MPAGRKPVARAEESRPGQIPLRAKAKATRSKIVDAAARVVARDGYPKATIAKITTEAGIASGLFYYYFKDKEDLFGELLPELGSAMIAFITERTAHLEHSLDREIARFEAYFEFLGERPEFYRVFTEAQVFVPEAYNKHMRRVMANFASALELLRKPGSIQLPKSDMIPLAYALMGVRNYLTQLLMSGDQSIRFRPKEFVRMYRKLLTDEIFRS